MPTVPTASPIERDRLLALAFVGSLVLGACASQPQPREVDSPRVITMTEWGGTPGPLPTKAQVVNQLTIHHQGEVWNEGSDVAAYLRRLQTWSRAQKGWSDIPYHYVLAPDGSVYAARPTAVSGDTNTEYDPTGHILVMLLGNFEVQTPSVRQWSATVNLLADLSLQYGLDPSNLRTHRDFSRETVCPGANLYARLPELRAEVIAVASLKRLKRAAWRPIDLLSGRGLSGSCAA
jgi:hypothetical protein